MGRIPVAGSDGRLRHRGVIPSGSHPAERIAGPPAVRFAGAVILAGGRSTRLGGVPKAALMADGVSLLARTVAAAAALVDADATLPQPKRGSRGAPRLPIAVVGPPELLRALVPEAEAVRWV